jgi:hypothetical protein
MKPSGLDLVKVIPRRESPLRESRPGAFPARGCRDIVEHCSRSDREQGRDSACALRLT